MKRALTIASLALGLSASARAQETLLPSTAWGFGPIASAWHFKTPIATPAGAVQDIAQAAVPLRVRMLFGGRWTFDVSGAYAVGAIHVVQTDSTSSGDEERAILLSGPTDMKLRLSGPLVGDNLVFTAGVNIPTGKTRLDGDQTSVLQAVGAPALHMPIGAYGAGAGGTFGLVSAIERGAWAFALGASVEQRTEYTPIALAISGSSSETRLTPGMATHISAGADHALGSSRLSLLVVADAFSTDKITVTSGGSESGKTQYQLGPQISAFARLDFSGGAWSDGALNVSARRRSAFNDASGKSVDGSSGTYLEGSLGGVLGGTGHAGLVIGVDGRWHSGLPFTSSLVGAAATVGGVTLGVDLPAGGTMFRFAIHPQYGTFDTGVTKTTGVGGTIVLSFAARREAR